jgi:multicomponent Na+:H+ antiporter subunit E
MSGSGGETEYQKQAGAKGEKSLCGFWGSTRKQVSFGLTFCICFATWLILSGRFDRFHILLGVISCALVAFFSGDLLLPAPFTRALPKQWLAFSGYLPWLFYQIFKANLHMLYLVFHPRVTDHIDPRIIRFSSCLKGDMAFLIFANSITLTPGTITVYTSIYGEYTVHAIDKQSADALPDDMENRVARIFGE